MDKLTKTKNNFSTVGWLAKPRNICNCSLGLIRRLWILSTINRITVPVVLYCLYLVIGPWSIVEVVDGHIGYVFFHGIYLNGAYIPNALSSLYGFFQLVLCQLPLNFIFATLVNKRYCKYMGIQRKSKSSLLLKKLSHAPFVIIISVEILLAIVFCTDYGIVALLLSPFRAWSVIMNIVLWCLAKNIPYESLRFVAFFVVFIWLSYCKQHFFYVPDQPLVFGVIAKIHTKLIPIIETCKRL